MILASGWAKPLANRPALLARPVEQISPLIARYRLYGISGVNPQRPYPSPPAHGKERRYFVKSTRETGSVSRACDRTPPPVASRIPPITTAIPRSWTGRRRLVEAAGMPSSTVIHRLHRQHDRREHGRRARQRRLNQQPAEHLRGQRQDDEPRVRLRPGRLESSSSPRAHPTGRIHDRRGEGRVEERACRSPARPEVPLSQHEQEARLGHRREHRRRRRAPARRRRRPRRARPRSARRRANTMGTAARTLASARSPMTGQATTPPRRFGRLPTTVEPGRRRRPRSRGARAQVGREEEAGEPREAWNCVRRARTGAAPDQSQHDEQGQRVRGSGRRQRSTAS